MERAVQVTSLKNLEYLQPGQCQRIYWGAEFCQNLIPSLNDTAAILKFSKKNNLAFSFITPFVTEKGLERLKPLFALLEQERMSAEVIVNDWGVLGYLNNKYKKTFGLALGRLLVRQQRDPAMKRVLEKQIPFAFKGRDGKIRVVVHAVPDKRYQEGIRASYINSPLAQGFLSKFGVKRVELNNIIQGLNLKGIALKKSLYTPYVNISTTRFCPMRTKFQKIYRINVCRKECRKYYDILRNKAMPKAVYKRGNTTFYKNPVSIKDAAGLGIDRIVFQPELPFQ